MNWPKVIGWVGAVVTFISILAQLCARIVPEPHLHAEVEDVMRWARYLGAYTVLILGIHLYRTFEKKLYLVVCIIVAVLSLVPMVGFFITLGYFFWSFAKLERQGKGLPL